MEIRALERIFSLFKNIILCYHLIVLAKKVLTFIIIICKYILIPQSFKIFFLIFRERERGGKAGREREREGERERNIDLLFHLFMYS